MELSEVQKEADSAGRKAIVFGIGAMLIAGCFGAMLARLSGGGPETQPVVVAAEQIPALTQLKMDQLKVVDWPSRSLPKGFFSKPEDVIKRNELNVNGLIVGEPILSDRLASVERGLGLSQMVEPNMRAFVVQVQDSVALAELIHPGGYVDVVATLDDQKNREQVTKVILQNVQVLAVGASVDTEPPKSISKDEAQNDDHARMERHRVVTLLVGLADVETLAFASRNGRLDLTLRNNADGDVVNTQGVNMDKILGRKKSGPASNADSDGSHGGQAQMQPNMGSPATHGRASHAPSRSGSHSPSSSSNNSDGLPIYKVNH